MSPLMVLCRASGRRRAVIRGALPAASTGMPYILRTGLSSPGGYEGSPRLQKDRARPQRRPPTRQRPAAPDLVRIIEVMLRDGGMALVADDDLTAFGLRAFI